MIVFRSLLDSTRLTYWASHDLLERSVVTQVRDAAIVGVHEYPSRKVDGQISAMQIKARSAARALADAGLTWQDVDAIYDAAKAAVA